MEKESIFLYILRFLIYMGILFLLMMLYWSSNLTESTLIDIRNELKSLKSEIQSKSFNQSQEAIEKGQRSLLDPSLPNLLEQDPFYAKTLPKLLGPNFKPNQVQHLATLGRPQNLHPFSNWRDVSAWHSSCTDTVAHQKLGVFETQSPGFAIKMEARLRKDIPVEEYWVHLREDIYWEPLTSTMFQNRIQLAPQFMERHQVTAHDFKFYFDALMNPHVQEAGAVSLRNYLESIDSIEVLDDLTFVVKWKPTFLLNEKGESVPKIPYIAKLMTGELKPLPRFVYQYFPDGRKIIEDDSNPETYRNNSVWAQNFTEHWAKNIIVSCGPWVFQEMTDKQITFTRNPHYWENLGALSKAEEYAIKENPDSVWQDFKLGRLDSYNLQPDQLVEWKTFKNSKEYKRQASKGLAIERLDYLTRSYNYIGWNETTPYFQDKMVRRAMTMAIDRNRIIDDILNGLGAPITGPFALASPSYNYQIKPWPFSPTEAKKLLEEAGWYDTDGDGIIEKVIDGKRVPFVFTLTYYVKNPITKTICSYVSSALREVGVKCNLLGVDVSDLSAAFDGKTFDAIFLGWALGTPPEQPRQLWYSAGAKEKGSSNAVGFANPEADSIIDQLQFESDKQKRIALYHRFHNIIHQEQPYTFLYCPKTSLLYREYLRNVFIPSDRKDLIPKANVDQPQPQIFYIKKR